MSPARAMLAAPETQIRVDVAKLIAVVRTLGSATAEDIRSLAGLNGRRFYAALHACSAQLRRTEEHAGRARRFIYSLATVGPDEARPSVEARPTDATAPTVEREP